MTIIKVIVFIFYLGPPLITIFTCIILPKESPFLKKTFQDIYLYTDLLHSFFFSNKRGWPRSRSTLVSCSCLCLRLSKLSTLNSYEQQGGGGTSG